MLPALVTSTSERSQHFFCESEQSCEDGKHCMPFLVGFFVWGDFSAISCSFFWLGNTARGPSGVGNRG